VPNSNPREEILADRPQPRPTRDSAFYWEGALRGELLGQRCSGCSEFRHPPRPMCPSCLSVEWQAIRLTGRGRIYSWMLPVHPRMPIFEYPLICVLVDLEEGIRIFSNLYQCAPEDVATGMQVEVFFAPTKNGKAVPVFRPIEGNK
jgi:uncharacterized OB-fold protein